MHLHAQSFQRITQVTGVSTLLIEDARAILGVAQLVAGADDREDPDETAVLDEVVARINTLVTVPLALPNVQANDDYERLEKIREIGAHLTTPQTRELAYALAYAVTISDLELAPAESEFLADLAVALGIADDRTAELAQVVAESVTPPA